MYDAGKVITGLVIFLGLVTAPFWSGIGQSSPQPKVVIETEAEKCVESAAFMRANHMQLLDDWRHEVVRGEQRTYVNSHGEKFEKSLTHTCMGCHQNKEQFCDSCHNYASVDPYCWDCHTDHKGEI